MPPGLVFQPYWSVWITQTAATTPAVTGSNATTICSSWIDQGTSRQSLINRNRDRTRMLRRKSAARRAERLLLEHLTEAQRQEWTTDKAFHVETADGRRRYKIAYGLTGNVCLVKCEGEAPMGKFGPVREGARFCMHVYHPDGWVPNEDNVLAQKLLIEANEEHFLELANAS